MAVQGARLPDPIFDYDGWSARLTDLSRDFADAKPFPHVVLHDLLKDAVAQQMARDFPPPDAGNWTHYKHFNENKLVKSRREEFPESILKVTEELNGERFRAFLSALTGAETLLPDSEFSAGGGLGMCGPGGFLNVHNDFTVHPYHRNWRRRVNLILYLNDEWDEAWGGHTELWDSGVRSAVLRVPPILNSCLIFDTRPPSYHGHPDPIACPPGFARRTLGLYYFTEEHSPRSVSTDYQARPDDGPIRRSLIAADKLLVRAYHAVKRHFGIRDGFASRVLAILSRVPRGSD